MKGKLNAFVAALALLAAAGANAAMTANNVAPGNSSAVFVAWDNARTISVAIDLGVSEADFLQASSFVFQTGALAYNGSDVSASWNFGADSRAVNGAAVTGDYAWSTTWQSFLTASAGSYTWGVVAADNISGAVSATNLVLNRSLLSTANGLTTAQMTALTTSTPVSTANGTFQNFIPASNALGTHGTNAEGANAATSGSAYLGGSISSNFSGQVAWTYLAAPGATQQLVLAVQATNPTVYQVGTTYGVDSLLADPSTAATFTFDGTTLSYQVQAVPEPGTYAMLAAGLAFVGFIARRRKNG